MRELAWVAVPVLVGTVYAALGAWMFLFLAERVLRVRHPLLRPWLSRYAVVLALLPVFGAAAGEPVRLLLGVGSRALPTASSWIAAAAAMWLVGVVVAWTRTALAAARAERIRRTLLSLGTVVSTPVGPVVACAADGAPFVLGLLRPTVFVPLGFLQGLSDEAVVAAVRHEQAHTARLDPLRRLALRLVGDLLWFNWPLRRLLRRLEAEAEGLADRAAVRAGSTPLALATALVHAAQHRPGRLQGAVGLGGDSADGLTGRLAALRRPAGRLRLLLSVALVALVLPLPVLSAPAPIQRVSTVESRLAITLGSGVGRNPTQGLLLRALVPEPILRELSPSMAAGTR